MNPKNDNIDEYISTKNIIKESIAKLPIKAKIKTCQLKIILMKLYQFLKILVKTLIRQSEVLKEVYGKC